jgi:Protein of unknown function (DUF3145)
MPARGVLHIHACPAALCPHVTWAVSRELGVRVEFGWADQPAEPGMLRAEAEWTGRVGTAGRLARALSGWSPLRFEVTELATQGADGYRYSYSGDLGLFTSPISANGDIMVGEDRLRALVASGEDLRRGLETLLGSAWDAELEPYRMGAAAGPVTRMTRVV